MACSLFARVSSVLALGAAVAAATSASACLVLDVDPPSLPHANDAATCVCPARNGGESDHAGGDHWFNGPEFCGCASVAGAPETTCRDVCAFRDVRFVDSDGVVCSCDASNAIECAGDADEDGTCRDGDGDGVCDDG